MKKVYKIQESKLVRDVQGACYEAISLFIEDFEEIHEYKPGNVSAKLVEVSVNYDYRDGEFESQYTIEVKEGN